MEFFPRCNQANPVGAVSRYFVKRVDAEGLNAYVYYASEKPVEVSQKNDARAIAYGTKEGKCTLGLAPAKNDIHGDPEPEGIDENCGFEARVLKYCMQDRGKKTTNPLAPKPGFNPTKGPFAWRNPEIARQAAANCDLIIQAEIVNFQRPAVNEDAPLRLLSEMASIASAAYKARFNSDSSMMFNRVFVDAKADHGMIITNTRIFRQLFPVSGNEINPTFTTRRQDYNALLRQILPHIFFCVCPTTNLFCSTILSQSDTDADERIKRILLADSLTTTPAY